MNVRKHWKNKSGIYKITCNTNYICYIGSSKELYSRLAVHISHLRSNVHHSMYMQRCFNKYGEKYFSIEIIEYCENDEKLLRERELFYMHMFNCKFNSASPIYYSHSPEVCKKISNTLKNKYKSGEIISAAKGNGRMFKIYDYKGNLIFENKTVDYLVSYFKYSNRSVINNILRSGGIFLKRKKYIIIPQNKDFYESIKDYFKSNNIKDSCIYKIHKTKDFYRVKGNYKRMYNSIIKNENLLYYSKKHNCIFTFSGLINIAVQNSNILNYEGAKTKNSEIENIVLT